MAGSLSLGGPAVYDALLGAPVALVALFLLAPATGQPVRRVLRLAAPPRAARAALVRFVPLVVAWYLLLALSLAILLPLPGWLVDLYERLAPHSQAEMAAFLFTTVMAAPLVEELLLRGLALSVLGTAFGRAPAVMTTAIVFGAMHLAPAKAVATAAFGYMLGRAAWSTRSIVPGIAAHMLANAVALGAGLRASDTLPLPDRRAAGMALGIALLLTPVVWRAVQRVEQASADVEDAAAGC